MFIRAAVAAALAVIVVTGCTERPKYTSPPRQEVPVCKGLPETQCNKNSQCVWNAEKDKCKKKENDSGEDSRQSDPDGGSQQSDPDWGADEESRH